MTLEGKVALVTGGSQGIGAAIAKKLASEGADIAILYVGNPAPAEETVAAIEAMGRRVVCKVCDVSNYEETQAAVKDVMAQLGGVDILVNNAGITRDKVLLAMSEADWDAVLDVNLKGAFHFIRHTYSGFLRQRAGRIVNISSVVGLMGNAGQGNYSSAKAGLVGLTKSVAKELASRNVTCNAIAPGFIETDMTADLADKVKDEMMKQIPLKRFGQAEDVANAAAFLVSDEAAYITGQVLHVDGGMVM